MDMKKARHIFFGMNQLLNHRSCFVFSNKSIAVETRMSHILHVVHAERNQTAGDAPKRKQNYFDYCLSIFKQCTIYKVSFNLPVLIKDSFYIWNTVFSQSLTL